MSIYYQDESVTLYHGDSLELVREITGYDVGITDPPYGVEFKGKRTKWTTKATGGYASIEDDESIVTAVAVPVIVAMISTGKPVCVTPGMTNMFHYPNPTAVGSIYYPSGAGMCKWGFVCSQPIYYYGPDPYLAASKGSRPNSFSSTASAQPNGHPCPKPISTMQWLVERCSFPGQTVIDPFAGSGTTLVAASQLGRKAIGVELEERYCEVIAKRLAQGVLDFGDAS